MSSEPATTARTVDAPRLFRGGVAALCGVKLLLHIPGLFRYGYFRDELDFPDCGRHLQLGDVMKVRRCRQGHREAGRAGRDRSESGPPQPTTGTRAAI